MLILFPSLGPILPLTSGTERDCPHSVISVDSRDGVRYYVARSVRYTDLMTMDIVYTLLYALKNRLMAHIA